MRPTRYRAPSLPSRKRSARTWPRRLDFAPSTTASVVANVINGDYWPPAGVYTDPVHNPLATGCPLRPNDLGIIEYQPTYGAEVNGFGHFFYNNEIEQHTGGGMQIHTPDEMAPNPFGRLTGQITVSSANPWDPSDTPRYIEMNNYHGIIFHGPPHFSTATEGVALDAVLIRNNTGNGVYFEDIPDYVVLAGAIAPRVNGTYTGFTPNGSCSGSTSLTHRVKPL
jgi:hypothetical protein